MPVYKVDPLTDSRWPDLLQRHPMASAFHTAAWLEALRRTYQYEPVVLTTTEPGQPLKNGVVFCEVKSWLTGSRLVSLPFSDHCQPLVENRADLLELLSFVKKNLPEEQWQYVELRPLAPLDVDVRAESALEGSKSFWLHNVDLSPNTEDLFRSLHKTSVRQMISRAGKRGVTISEGRSDSFLHLFYKLLLLTRRRHQVPPQPLSWFRNLIHCLGERLMIRVAFKGGEPIASILTLSHKKSVVYKYGCSDERFHNLGSMHLLFWHTIQASKAQGADTFDLGRSDLDNAGLISFKDHWGATRSQLTYYRYPGNSSKRDSQAWQIAVARKAFSCLPDPCLAAAGRLLYKHVG